MAGKRGNPNFVKKDKDLKDIKKENDTQSMEDNKIESKISDKREPKIKVEKKPEWKPDLNRMICVKNIAKGKLIYKSKRQIGYMIEWDKSGDINYMELGEFINLRNSDRRFVTEPWVRVIEDDEIEILNYANVFQYYKNLLDIDNTKDVLLLDFESFKKKFDGLPKSVKDTIATQAAEMLKSGELDSIKIKNYIGEALDIDIDILIK